MITRSKTAVAAAGIASHFTPSAKAATASRRPIKRSASAAALLDATATAPAPATATATDPAPPRKKRLANVKSEKDTVAVADARTKKAPSAPPQLELVPPPGVTEADCALRTTLPQPTLPFDLAAARDHLCSVDARFTRLFNLVPLRTYEESFVDRQLNLFKTITTSILGQQISWLAARSVLYKFCRLFAPSMPEKPDFVGYPRDKWPFPTPLQILNTSDTDLRAAGLSFAKIKYIKDLSLRFADGRLDIRSLIQLTDEEEYVAELSKIKGVGRWTSEMILMFALHRPDVLPCGDLGVQKGMLNFFLSPEPKISIKKRRTPAEQDEDQEQDQVSSTSTSTSIATAALVENNPESDAPSLAPLPALPSGITQQMLAHRAAGNKVKPGVYLTPDEMHMLAAQWAPYRSVATMFMWALVDV